MWLGSAIVQVSRWYWKNKEQCTGSHRISSLNNSIGRELRWYIAEMVLVRIQLERLSFVGEMIYLTVELNFHKTIILYIIV